MKSFLFVGLLFAVAVAEYAESDYTVTISNPGSLGCDTVRQYSGYISFQSKNLFFWFFESRGNATTDPVIMWLTGGPGCSSLLALFVENGPCSVNSDGTSLKLNPYSWNEAGSMIFVDQPVGTGFSYGSPEDSTEAQVAEDLYTFLQGFFGQFKQFRNNKFYVSGESYAGHYVPAITSRIVKGNQQGSPRINLVGASIGNGLVDPEIQYNYYAQMAYNNGIRRVVSTTVYNKMVHDTAPCVKEIARCNQGSSNAECDLAQARCNAQLIGPVQATGVNLYDIRIPCAVPPLCYDLSNVANFLNLASTKSALGVSSSMQWQSCNMEVNGNFRADWMRNYQTNIPPVLATGATVLVYAGEDDFICNWMGNKAWAVALNWPGQQQFNNTADQTWMVNGVIAGQSRTYENYSFVKVANAGHMVPMNQPLNSLVMIKTFLMK